MPSKGASLIAQLVKNSPAMQETQYDSWVGKICWGRGRLLTPVFLGLPCSSAGKVSACNVGDLGSIPGLGRSHGEGIGYPLQYPGLENSRDYSPWGLKESDMTERLSVPFQVHPCCCKWQNFILFYGWDILLVWQTTSVFLPWESHEQYEKAKRNATERWPPGQ